jgi:hypothetical protein
MKVFKTESVTLRGWSYAIVIVANSKEHAFELLQEELGEDHDICQNLSQYVDQEFEEVDITKGGISVLHLTYFPK